MRKIYTEDIMPRNVRNFWLEIDVGNKTPVATGPVRADGGFCLRVLQRHRGKVTKAGHIVGSVDESGKLVLTWENDRGDEIVLNETER